MREIIQNILFDADEVIPLKNEKVQGLYFYFYIDLLKSLEKEGIRDYTYSIDLIREIHNKNKIATSNIVKIILAKVNIDLIKTFKDTGQYKDEYQEEIKILEDESQQIISENLNFFQNIGYEVEKEYLNQNIDIIYADIINFLIKNKKFEDYEFILALMKDIDIENIIITKKIYDELNATLNNEEVVKIYKISCKDDIWNENKINFYYIFLRFIFKSSFYIYNLTFFLETRKLIINLLRTNEVLIKRKNILYNDKISFVVKKLADSKYYFVKLEKLELIYEYYTEILFESKKDDILLIEEIFNNTKNIEDKLLNDYNDAVKIHKKIPIIKYIFNEKYGLGERNENEMKKVIEIWNRLEKMIKANKIKKMLNDERQIICKYFRDQKNKDILIENFGQQVYDNFIIKINDFYKENEALEQENKKEKNENKDNLSTQENKTTNLTPIDKPREKTTPKMDPIGEDSTTSESQIQKSIDSNTALPPITKFLQKKDIFDIANYILQKCNIFFHTNKKGTEPYIIYDEIYYGYYELKIDYLRLMQYKQNLYCFNTKEPSLINLKYFFEFLEEIEKRIKEEFENEYILKINLELILEKENINEDNICNITAYYTFYEPFNQRRFKYKEENVLINKTNSMLQGFQFMIYDINSGIYKSIKYSEDLFFKKEIYLYDDDNEEDKINYFMKNEEPYEITPSKYTIIEHIKTLGNTKNSADFIKELSNGYFLIGSQNMLHIYDHQFIEKPTLTIKCKDWVYSVCERILFNEKSKNSNNLQVICCMNGNIGLLEISDQKNKLTIIEAQSRQNTKKNSKKDKAKNNTYNICIEMRENNYIMSGLRGAVYFRNFFGNNDIIEQSKIIEDTYRGGIKLNENIVALTSNSILPQGKDKLIFYNVKTGKLTEFGENYSFLVSEHNMVLIPRYEAKLENKILLCICKKYSEGQKNGILLVNPKLGKNVEIKKPFYDLNNFEISCICPILNIKNKNENYDLDKIEENYKQNIEIQDTDFFFVCGYDIEKMEGVIKLFKIIFKEKFEDTKIKFLQNIEIRNTGNFQGFKEQIKCMIQSKITGNFLVTCADGNIILLTKPNLELYIKK